MLIRYADASCSCAWCSLRSVGHVQAWGENAGDKLSAVYRCRGCGQPSLVSPVFKLHGPFRIPTFRMSSAKVSEARLQQLYRRLGEGHNPTEKDLQALKA